MRQSHPEINFRLGKGRIREIRKAFSRDSLAATCDLLGMNAAEKAAFLAETDAIRTGIEPERNAGVHPVMRDLVNGICPK